MIDEELNAPGKQVLSGLLPDELAACLSPLPRFRSRQIFKWLSEGAPDFDGMSDLPLALRKELGERFVTRSSKINSRLDDSDGTVKLGITLEDGAQIEAVLLADGKLRHTACISTQAGCQAGCVFCKTGALGFRRNLTRHEIVEQFLFLREISGHISNIVVMGMGEPLLNLDELRAAINVISCKDGLNFSKRRITVSTCGIIKGIIDIADNGPAVRLALSLTTADEELRRTLMPISASQPLEKIKNALLYFQNAGGGRVTLEAVLLGGINTRERDAQTLAEFARGLDAVINLIPWNPVETGRENSVTLREPSRAEVENFTRRARALGLNVTCRYRKGRSVSGACGQLGCV